MHEISNECVGCPPEIGCMGNSCPYMHVVRYYCDRCHDEIGPEVYRVDGEDLCEWCLKDKFRIFPDEDE